MSGAFVDGLYKPRYVASDDRVGDAELPELLDVMRARGETDLSLYGQPITDAGLAALAAEGDLTGLNLTGTRITDAGLASLAALRQLRTLVLNATAVTGCTLDALAELPELTTIGLNQGAADDGALLARLPRLVSVGVNHTRASDALARSLAGSPALRRVGIGWTRLTDDGAQALAEAPNLDSIQLSGTSVSDAGVCGLVRCRPGLRELFAAGCATGPAALHAAAGLERLERLDVSGPGVGLLRGACPAPAASLRVLELAERHLGAALPAWVAALPRLQVLGLAGCVLEDDVAGLIAALRGSTSLEVLDLSRTGTQDEHLRRGLDLPALQVLDLSETAVSDASLPALRGCLRLHTLILKRTRVQSDAARISGSLPSLRRLLLDGSPAGESGGGS